MESSSFLDSQSSSPRSWTIFGSFMIFRQISPLVQKHLIKVYFLLCCTLMASVFGVILHMLLNIGGFLTFFATLGCLYSILTSPTHEKKKRVAVLMVLSTLHGATIGPLIELTIDVDPGILVSAFISTAIVFACFSGTALLARRRVFLYLGGFLSSCFSILVWAGFASLIFGDSAALFIIQMYFGLLVFIGYVVVDTQEIIESAHLGNLDYVTDALLLSTDFIAIFARILIIMLEYSSEEKEKKEKKQRK
ncbi:bax inhibitor 1 [Lactuca sativa]|uniref:bax inhibitor 1 n=1 Tax=Lactuca sativa TaxID=4236 RepID=UPI001C68BC00|nr:bax inhibitor 1 [Lactuca sativa]